MAHQLQSRFKWIHLVVAMRTTNTKNKRTNKLEWWYLMLRSRNLKLRRWLLFAFSYFFRREESADRQQIKAKVDYLVAALRDLWYASQKPNRLVHSLENLVTFYWSWANFYFDICSENHPFDISNANKSLCDAHTHTQALSFAKWIKSLYIETQFHSFFTVSLFAVLRIAV